MSLLAILAFMTCLGAGTIGGVFFAFSAFVMPALAQLPPAQGMPAMQRINIVVMNPLFLGAFLGTALLSAACIGWGVLDWVRLRSPLLIAGGALYLFGTFGVTMLFNVPRNDFLGRLDVASETAAIYWPRYVAEWSLWNHLRTIAALAAAACCAAGLAV